MLETLTAKATSLTYIYIYIILRAENALELKRDADVWRAKSLSRNCLNVEGESDSGPIQKAANKDANPTHSDQTSGEGHTGFSIDPKLCTLIEMNRATTIAKRAERLRKE